MAWTTPKTWSSEPLTSNDLNTHVRDNLSDIRARQDSNDDYIADETSDFTTTVSANFVDVDPVNNVFELTITTNGGKVMVVFCGTTRHEANHESYFNIAVDGDDYFEDDGLMYNLVRASTGPGDAPTTICALIEGLTAGEHTFTLRWKVESGGTNTIFAGAGTSGRDIHPQFWVQEL